MGGLFSRFKRNKVRNANQDPNDDNKIDQDKIDQVVLDLKVARDQLIIYQKQQEGHQEVELQRAKEFARKGQKERAKIVLRQKKAREYYINNAQKNIANIETLLNQVTSKQIEIEVFNAMKDTNEILKKMNSLMPIAEVERIMDENQEQQKRLDEINSLLAQDMSANQKMKQFVEVDLDRMYDELDIGEQEEQNNLSENSENVPAAPQAMAC
ncbi:Charged multivesicular body protein 6 [Tritrichomonas musculus]|uniref:Charged multivesicular body protein 6 n=1 Tax=Tritrichomonas musculus TaxID=1915356 RepID=A0ABR2J1V7_9EUKA